MKIVLFLISFCISMFSACQAASRDVNNISFRGDSTLMGMKIEGVYAQNGAFLVVTTGARYEYAPGELKVYQGLGSNKRLLSIITFDQNTLFEKVADTNDHAFFWSEKFNMGIYCDGTGIISAKARLKIILKGQFVPTYQSFISNELLIMGEIDGLALYFDGNGSKIIKSPDKFTSNWELKFPLAPGQTLILSPLSNYRL